MFEILLTIGLSLFLAVVIVFVPEFISLGALVVVFLTILKVCRDHRDLLRSFWNMGDTRVLEAFGKGSIQIVVYLIADVLLGVLHDVMLGFLGLPRFWEALLALFGYFVFMVHFVVVLALILAREATKLELMTVSHKGKGILR